MIRNVLSRFYEPQCISLLAIVAIQISNNWKNKYDFRNSTTTS